MNVRRTLCVAGVAAIMVGFWAVSALASDPTPATLTVNGSSNSLEYVWPANDKFLNYAVDIDLPQDPNGLIPVLRVEKVGVTSTHRDGLLDVGNFHNRQWDFPLFWNPTDQVWRTNVSLRSRKKPPQSGIYTGYAFTVLGRTPTGGLEFFTNVNRHRVQIQRQPRGQLR